MKEGHANGPAARPLTIGRLARAAGVGVETIRYYQGRGLLPVPPTVGGIRYYAPSLVARIGFIKRAQGLGFTLQEIATLLDLADGRNRSAVRAVTSARLDQIRDKVRDLSRMEATLNHLLATCIATGEVQPCPIIEALVCDMA
jgi:MerR family transcriptional regulator, mercuric resistance operon regulatory protein